MAHCSYTTTSASTPPRLGRGWGGGSGAACVSPVSAEADWSHCESELVRGVAVVKHGQVPQGQQGELLGGELEDGVGDGGLVVQLKGGRAALRPQPPATNHPVPQARGSFPGMLSHPSPPSPARSSAPSPGHAMHTESGASSRLEPPAHQAALQGGCVALLPGVRQEEDFLLGLGLAPFWGWAAGVGDLLCGQAAVQPQEAQLHRAGTRVLQLQRQ